MTTQTRPGVSSCPPGCKISPHNSKVSIEQNFALSSNVTVLKTNKTTLGISSCLQGWIISPHNSKVSIEQILQFFII